MTSPRPAAARAAAALLTLLSALGGPGAVTAQSVADRDSTAPVIAPIAPAGFDALVLSTGSSRGLAHAGALLGLERQGFEPELVTGASMGAVIGALYAAGYSAEQVWDIVLGTDWGDLFMASPIVVGPERRLLFPGVTLGLDVQRREVSSGFVPDWRVNRYLTRLLFDADARARSDFDRLPRRYRSVTADLANGREVVLKQGDLARAVRASMGTPAFFSAMRWGDRTLVDGGIADYLPVSVARRLGAGRVVAVDVSRAPPQIGRTDPTALAGRSIALLMRNALPDTTPPDVLIRPAVDPDFPGAVFPAEPRYLLDLGVAAARDAEVAPTVRAHPRLIPAPPTAFGALEIEPNEPALMEMARRVYGPAAAGGYRPEAVLAATDRLYQTGLFSGVWPRVERRAGAAGADSMDVLVIGLDPYPRIGLEAAAGYENDRGGRGWAEVGVRRSLFRDPVEGRLGAGTDGLERWFEGSVLVHSSRWAGVAWNAGLHRRQITVPFLVGPDDRPQVRHTGGWGALRHRRGEVIASVAAQAERLEVEGGPSGLSWGGLLRLSSTRAPTLVIGVPRELSVEARTGVLDYATVRARTALYLPPARIRVAAVVDGAATVGDPPPDERPTLGEGHGMPGLRWGQERGRARLLGGVDASTSIMGSGWGRVRLRAGAAPDRARDLTGADAWLGGVAFEAGWSTPFGPVQVGYGVNTRGSHRIDVGLGGAF